LKGSRFSVPGCGWPVPGLGFPVPDCGRPVPGDGLRTADVGMKSFRWGSARKRADCEVTGCNTMTTAPDLSQTRCKRAKTGRFFSVIFRTFPPCSCRNRRQLLKWHGLAKKEGFMGYAVLTYSLYAGACGLRLEHASPKHQGKHGIRPQRARA
jgi:hypothetical protein